MLYWFSGVLTLPHHRQAFAETQQPLASVSGLLRLIAAAPLPHAYAGLWR